MFGFLMGIGCGGVAVWYGKDMVTKLFLGAEAFAAGLQAKVNAITSATPPPKA